MGVPSTPGWVIAPDSYQGQDVLGLRTPVQRIGNDCLDGVTTTTPSLRYLSIFCWLVRNYWVQRRPADLAAFHDFVWRSEFALVVGNKLVNPGATGLLGAQEAQRIVAEAQSRFAVEQLAQGNVAGTYGNVAVQLHLTAPSDSPVPRLTEGRGAALADAVGEVLDRTALGHQLAQQGPPSVMEREKLAQLGEAARIDQPTPAERELLGEALVPTSPLDAAERRRCGSYGLALHHAELIGQNATRSSFIGFVASSVEVPPALVRIRGAWRFYLTRDMLAVLHERALQAVVLSTETLADGDGLVTARSVLEHMLSAGEHNEILREFDLLPAARDVATVTIRELHDRLAYRTADAVVEAGCLRWRDPLQEEALMRRSWSADESIIALLPVAWLLVCRRNLPVLEEAHARGPRIARAGWGRMGLTEVVAPTVARWLEDDVTLLGAMAELARRTVDQHLRIVWGRRRTDPHRDAAVLSVDGESWRVRETYHGGRSLTRLEQAFGWLDTLGWWSESGLTDAGQAAYVRALASAEAP